METIYKIYDAGDSKYSIWYATEDGIVKHLEEQKEHIPNYNKEDGWVKNLERYGLTFEILYKDRQIINHDVYEMEKDYKKALDKIWDYITNLKEFGNECKCPEKDETETSFDTIDYTGDTPNVSRWCLNCGGYRNG